MAEDRQVKLSAEERLEAVLAVIGEMPIPEPGQSMGSWAVQLMAWVADVRMAAKTEEITRDNG